MANENLRLTENMKAGTAVNTDRTSRSEQYAAEMRLLSFGGAQEGTNPASIADYAERMMKQPLKVTGEYQAVEPKISN
jgi:hypothetical protein